MLSKEYWKFFKHFTIFITIISIIIFLSCISKIICTIMIIVGILIAFFFICGTFNSFADDKQFQKGLERSMRRRFSNKRK